MGKVIVTIETPQFPNETLLRAVNQLIPMEDDFVSALLDLCGAAPNQSQVNIKVEEAQE